MGALSATVCASVWPALWVMRSLWRSFDIRTGLVLLLFGSGLGLQTFRHNLGMPVLFVSPVSRHSPTHFLQRRIGKESARQTNTSGDRGWLARMPRLTRKVEKRPLTLIDTNFGSNPVTSSCVLKGRKGKRRKRTKQSHLCTA